MSSIFFFAIDLTIVNGIIDKRLSEISTKLWVAPKIVLLVSSNFSLCLQEVMAVTIPLGLFQIILLIPVYNRSASP